LLSIVHILRGRCNPDSANGVERTLFNLACCQAKAGHKVSIFGLSAKDLIPINGVDVRHFPEGRYPLAAPRSLRESLSTLGPDVVHFHSSYVPAHVALAGFLRRRGIPYTVTPNGGCAPQILKRGWLTKLPYKHLFELPFLNGASFVHSVGDTEDIRAYGVAAPIVLAPNGFSFEKIDTHERSAADPIRDGRPSWKNRLVFLYLGRLDAGQKGLDLLLKGFVRTLSQRPQCRLVLVGPDWRGHQARLQELCRELEIEDAVIFTGPVRGATKYDYLRAADFFVHPSRWEGMPFAVSEALACGKPCLVTPAADPTGLIARYDAGLVTRPTIEGVTSALVALADLPDDQRSAMSAQAQALVAKELDWHKIASTLTQAYETYAAPKDDR
jgi:glycosyltransferase involved in cell wall biosynthesis